MLSTREDEKAPSLCLIESCDVNHRFLRGEKNLLEGLQITIENLLHDLRIVCLEKRDFPAEPFDAVEENVVNLLYEEEPPLVLDFSLDRHLSRRSRLKVKMLRGGSPALWSIVKHGPARAQVGNELKEVAERFIDELGTMVDVGNGEVKTQDGHGVTEDEVFSPVEDPFLIFGEMRETEEASLAFGMTVVYVCRAALHSRGVILEADGKLMTRYIPFPAIAEGLIAPLKDLPAFFLLREELKAESREILSTGEGGKGLSAKQSVSPWAFGIGHRFRRYPQLFALR